MNAPRTPNSLFLLIIVLTILSFSEAVFCQDSLYVAPSGNVGIGTNSPSTKLDVNGDLSCNIASMNGGRNKMTVNGYWSEMRVRASSTGVCPRFYFVPSTDSGYTSNCGEVVAGTASQPMHLTVYGSIYYSGVLDHFSDERIKKNIQIVPNALNRLSSVNGVNYIRTNHPKLPAIGEIATRVQYGVIAQNVETVFPELVTTDPETQLKRVNEIGLIAPLIEAVKELGQRVEALEAENEQLTN